ncbi:hypothetical protein AURDEDRAFT_113683 [Auricularia subglabra TFB-10046 SS5]|nr:hypothetical protein AURDEDRAFT_113683 [Auricularia subglabra TFB-10046 SS5]
MSSGSALRHVFAKHGRAPRHRKPGSRRARGTLIRFDDTPLSQESEVRTSFLIARGATRRTSLCID